MRFRWAPVAVLIAVIVATSLARVSRLGDTEFWFDEFLHVFPAQSLAHDGVPRLPSGAVYERGIEITRLVSIAQRHVADPETAARLPSALMGIANVLIFAAIAWRVGGPWTAVWAALLMGTYPGAFREARNTRFYTEQLNLGLVAFWFGWLSVRDGARASSNDVVRTWAYIAGAVIAFAAATRIQVTTLSVAFGFGVILAIAAAVDVRELGRSAVRRSARVQAVLLGVIGTLLVVAVRPDVVATMSRVAFYVPAWAAGQFSPKAYYWILSTSLPLVFALFPVILIAVAARNVRLAVYLCLWFGIPLALHSFVFHLQAERYVLLAMPGLLLASAVAATMACEAGFRAVRNVLGERGLAARLAAGVAALCIFGSAAAVVATSPGFALTRKLGEGPLGRKQTDWRGVGDVLRRVPGSDTIPWGTSTPLASLFYSGRADFAIVSIFDQDDPGARPPAAGAEQREYYTGVPFIPTPAAIRERFGAKGAVLISIDSVTLADQRERQVITTLRREAVELCELRCGPMRIFYWRFADSTRGVGVDPFRAPVADAGAMHGTAAGGGRAP